MLFAGIASVLIAAISGIASYIDSYLTESAGQYVAHDLRVRTFHHLQRLSLGYYNTHQIGTLLSTITTDVQTIQNFASSSILPFHRRTFTDIVSNPPTWNLPAKAAVKSACN
ncbi:MAG: ABC transporter transmembrane domain-containing protein [Candidatus Sulfotelmatobacter sp.]